MALTDAVSALVALGYGQDDARKAADAGPARFVHTSPIGILAASAAAFPAASPFAGEATQHS